MTRVSRAFWAYYGAFYDAIWDSAVTDRIADAVNSSLPDRTVVLDFGCGTGLISKRLVERNHQVVAVDPSRSMLSRAQAGSTATEFYLAERPPPDRQFGAAIAINVLHLADSPAQILTSLFAATNGQVIAVWPEDDVNLLDLAGWEREGGRSLAWVLRALVFRVLVGIPGVLFRVRTAAESSLRQVSVEVGAMESASIDFRSIPGSGCVMAIFTTDRTKAPVE